MSKKCKKQAEAKRDDVVNHQKYNLNHWYYGNTQSFMPSCATVDQESRTHGLIIGSGKPVSYSGSSPIADLPPGWSTI